MPRVRAHVCLLSGVARSTVLLPNATGIQIEYFLTNPDAQISFATPDQQLNRRVKLEPGSTTTAVFYFDDHPSRRIGVGTKILIKNSPDTNFFAEAEVVEILEPVFAEVQGQSGPCLVLGPEYLRYLRELAEMVKRHLDDPNSSKNPVTLTDLALEVFSLLKQYDQELVYPQLRRGNAQFVLATSQVAPE